jgi:hypothetical protein
MYRGGGSIAIAAAARNCLLARIPGKSRDPILASYKSNLSKPPKTISYRVVEDKKREVGRIEWLESVDITADDALANDAIPEPGKRQTASKAERNLELQEQVVETLMAYPDGLRTSALRMVLKVRMNRLYEAITALLTLNRIAVYGSGPQRHYRVVPQALLPEGEDP